MIFYSVILLLICAFILAVFYWLGSVHWLKKRREKMFVQLLPSLSHRHFLLKKLAGYVAEQVKSEKGIDEKIQLFCHQAQTCQTPIRKRMALEEELFFCSKQLDKVVQKYATLRKHPAIMECQLSLADLEEKLLTQLRIFNYLTESYNRQIEVLPMRLLKKMLKVQQKNHYQVIDGLKDKS